MVDYIWIILALLVIAGATWWRNRESMTNADVQSVMQTFGTTKEPSKTGQPSQTPIKGPRAVPPSEEDIKERESVTKFYKGSSYPNIYGPDIAMAPGTKPGLFENSKEKDDMMDSYYMINRDLQSAFPTEGPPQPYLADFSKIQR